MAILEAPELYSFTDSLFINSTKLKVSPIKSINGKDAAEYMAGVADTLSYQDPDARYNTLFYNLAGVDAGLDMPFGAFAYNSGMYPGSYITTIELRNGSSLELKTIAKLNYVDWDAKDGKGAFDLGLALRLHLPRNPALLDTPNQIMGGVRDSQSIGFANIFGWVQQAGQMLSAAVNPDGSSDFVTGEELARLNKT
ncbi:hypothetical protein FZEAL_9880, partial [Fusarium zealandicum]